MSIGTSILLLVVGAILRFAISVTTTGFNLHTIGVILMIAGAVGLVLSFLWIAIWSGRRREAAVERQPATREREREPY
ncbi:MAG: DUF6458 family protein [Solirubrobacteraceae bacterium]